MLQWERVKIAIRIKTILDHSSVHVSMNKLGYQTFLYFCFFYLFCVFFFDFFYFVLVPVWYDNKNQIHLFHIFLVVNNKFPFSHSTNESQIEMSTNILIGSSKDRTSEGDYPNRCYNFWGNCFDFPINY